MDYGGVFVMGECAGGQANDVPGENVYLSFRFVVMFWTGCRCDDVDREEVARGWMGRVVRATVHDSSTCAIEKPVDSGT